MTRSPFTVNKSSALWVCAPCSQPTAPVPLQVVLRCAVEARVAVGVLAAFFLFSAILLLGLSRVFLGFTGWVVCSVPTSVINAWSEFFVSVHVRATLSSTQFLDRTKSGHHPLMTAPSTPETCVSGSESTNALLLTTSNRFHAFGHLAARCEEHVFVQSSHQLVFFLIQRSSGGFFIPNVTEYPC